MVAKDELTLAILAGGRAARLGGIDKGSLICEGRTLRDRLLDLGTLCAATVVIRDDVVPGKGAPVGVVTALTAAKTKRLLIACCDMPPVPDAAALALIRSAGKDVTLFEAQPFPGLYRSALAVAWRARLLRNPSMSELLGTVERVQLPCTDPRWVRSVNTVEDARALNVEIP